MVAGLVPAGRADREGKSLAASTGLVDEVVPAFALPALAVDVEDEDEEGLPLSQKRSSSSDLFCPALACEAAVAAAEPAAFAAQIGDGFAPPATIAA